MTTIGSYSDGVETRFIVNLHEHATAMAAANLAYFGEHRPTSSTIGVQSLFFPGQLIEVNFIIDTRLPPDGDRHGTPTGTGRRIVIAGGPGRIALIL
jgi:hypothetical protein